MQDNFINEIHPFIKFLFIFVLFIMILISKSLYLILFITTLILILIFKFNKSIFEYLNKICTHKFLLITIFLIFIFIFRIFNFFDIIYALYKYLLLIFLLNIFILNTTFEEINLILYYILSPLKYLKINISKLSFDISISLYLIKKFFDSKNKINYLKNTFYKKKCSIYDSLSSKIIYAIDETLKLENSLEMEFYKINKMNINLKSKIIFLVIMILFIISIIKEVIL